MGKPETYLIIPTYRLTALANELTKLAQFREEMPDAYMPRARYNELVQAIIVNLNADMAYADKLNKQHTAHIEIAEEDVDNCELCQDWYR